MTSCRILLLFTIVCCISSLVYCSSPSSNSLCVFSANQFTSLDSVMQCFYSIPVNQSVKNQTVDALKKALQLYTFLDISRDSPEPRLPVHVDMLAALDYILKWPHKFDYEFHDDLRALFLLLGDAHTQYYAPLCYTSFTAQQPMAPISVTNNNTQQIIAVSEYFPSSLVQYYKQNFNVDIKSFAGAEIVSIDGYPAFEYLVEYANTSVGMSKDLGSRLNYALTRPNPRPGLSQVSYGYWQSRTRRNPFPTKPAVTYEFRFSNGTILSTSFQWAIQCTKNYTGPTSFLADYWATNSSSSSSSSSSSANIHSPSVPNDNIMNDPITYKTSSHSFATSNTSETFTLLVNSTDLTFWKLSDNKTLVMYLDTFGPSNMTETYLALNKGFEAAANEKLSRLIIDLSNNGGGSICFGRSLIAYLQQTEGGSNYGPEDISTSPLQRNLTLSSVALNVRDTVWSPAAYANFTNQPIDQNDTSYLIPGVPHIRGGVPRNYSRLIHLNDCGNFGYRIKPAKNFTANEILILTNGFCGSTCALFSNHLANYDNVRTVVYGGINGRDQQYTAFPGGQVLDSAGFYQTLTQLGQNTAIGNAAPGEICPRQLPTTAAYRFCVREIYPPNRKYSAKPSEFTFAQSSHQVPYSYLTANSPQYAWYEILPFFP